jgi:hypothetical protein
MLTVLMEMGQLKVTCELRTVPAERGEGNEIGNDSLWCFQFLGTMKLFDFSKVCDWFNACEGIECHLSTVDVRYPGTKVIEVDFVPWQDWTLSRS